MEGNAAKEQAQKRPAAQVNPEHQLGATEKELRDYNSPHALRTANQSLAAASSAILTLTRKFVEKREFMMHDDFEEFFRFMANKYPL